MQLTLARNYDEKYMKRSSEWWSSIKYDGWRAYWDGKRLWSRSGKEIVPPRWWSSAMPHQALDGELYTKRGAYEKLSGILRSIDKSGWKQVKYHAFDMPKISGPFRKRYAKLKQLVARTSNTSPLRLVVHKPLRGDPQRLANAEIAKGGEGIMLRNPNSAYKKGRSSDLLKVKDTRDAEARVLHICLDKGGKMKALCVRMVRKPNAIFRLGTGFTAAQRLDRKYFRVGDVLTIKFNGFTAKGVPRHAVYLRHR